MSRFMKCFKHIEAGVRHTEAWKNGSIFLSKSKVVVVKLHNLDLEMILCPNFRRGSIRTIES